MIEVLKKSSRDAGSCNACSRYSTPNGVALHPVLEVNLRTLSFRLCEDCRKELLNRLFEARAI